MSGNHYPSHKLSEYFLLKKGKGSCFQDDTSDKIASGVVLTQIAKSEPQPYKEKIISIL